MVQGISAEDFDKLIRAMLAGDDGMTVYSGEERYAGRYIVGGIETVIIDEEFYALTTIKAIVELADKCLDKGAETLGFWRNRGKIFVDLGDSWYSPYAAMQEARRRGELAIWDRYENREISVYDSFQ